MLRKNGRSLVNQKFINPRNGATEEFSFCHCSPNAVIVFPVTKDKKIITVRQFRHAADDVFIEFPGGGKRSNESSLRAAKRELLEETGFSSQRIIRLKTRKIWFELGFFKNSITPYLATDCRQISEPKLDAMECMETVAIPINEWLDMVYDGLITDSKTLAVTLLALPHLGISLK